MQPINIPLSKKKIVLLILGSILFVVAGIWMFLFQADHQTRFNPLLVKIVGIAAVVFFGATGLVGIQKLFDTQMGLIIDQNGITDNSSGVSVGFIDWADVRGLRTSKVMSTKFILIEVNDSEKYINKATNFKARLLRQNLNMYGTPLCIASNTLDFSFNELESLLHKAFNDYKVKL
jgi:hypothetical protein